MFLKDNLNKIDKSEINNVKKDELELEYIRQQQIMFYTLLNFRKEEKRTIENKKTKKENTVLSFLKIQQIMNKNLH